MAKDRKQYPEDRIYISMKAKFKARLKSYCEQTGISVSEYVRYAVTETMKKEQED